jgi:hypothetical protein
MVPTMRCWCFVCVAALGAAGLRAEPRAAPQDEPHWASLSAPLRAGELELLGGLGGAYSGSDAVWPNPTISLGLGLRRGITDNLQLAFPLVATVSTDLDGLWPRLSLTTGIAGIGASNQLGVFILPTLGVGAHFVGERRLVVLRVSIGGGVPEQPGDANFYSGGGGGFAWRLDDTWSVGVSAGLSYQADAFSLATRSYSIGIGDSASLGSSSIPTVRWLANNVLSVELWTSLSTRYVVADEVSVTWFSAVVTATGHFF